MIAGLRFETGYDWPSYEHYFNEIPTFAEVFHYWDIEAFGTMEPMYGLLNSVIKSLGLPFQAILFIVSLFNAVVIFRFLHKYSFHIAYCLAIYFCWVFMKIQMGAIRQSICCSFLLLAFEALLTGRRSWYYGWVIMAALFQFSGIFFLLIGPLLNCRPSLRMVVGMCATGLIVLLGGIKTLGLLTTILHVLSVGFIAQKVDYYVAGALQTPSAIHYAYALGNVAFVIYCRSRFMTKPTQTDIMFFNISMCVVLLQLFAWQLPWLWNRMFYIAIIPQACILSKMLFQARISFRVLAFGSTAAVSLLVLSHFIMRPEQSLPYVPYQSYATYLITGDYGDGQLRMAEYDRIIADLKDR